MRKIAIIGGGLSGSLTALNLCLSLKTNARIYIIESSAERFYKGVAYSSDLKHQPLNVPVAGMSPFENEPYHFYNWLQQNYIRLLLDPEKITHSDFISRKVYGIYLKETIQLIIANAAPAIEVLFVEDIAVDIISAPENIEVILESGKIINAEQLVIATGVQNSVFPGKADKNLFEEGLIINDPWNNDALKNIQPDRVILIVGTGLTMVDIVINLRLNGHQGKIFILSRHGYIPRGHNLAGEWKIILPEDLSLLSMLRFVRAEIKAAAVKGIPWQSVMDSIRPHTPTLWKQFSAFEKAQFLNHIKAYWEIHRHRIPADSLERITNEINAGNIEVIAGSIDNVILANGELIITAKLRHEGNKKIIIAGNIINCTGPLANINRSSQPLWQNLLRRGYINTDHFNLGIECSADGNIIGSNGDVNSNIYVLGLLRKAIEWECTAMAEIRIQAKKCAEQISSVAV